MYSLIHLGLNDISLSTSSIFKDLVTILLSSSYILSKPLSIFLSTYLMPAVLCLQQSYFLFLIYLIFYYLLFFYSLKLLIIINIHFIFHLLNTIVASYLV